MAHFINNHLLIFNAILFFKSWVIVIMPVFYQYHIGSGIYKSVLMFSNFLLGFLHSFKKKNHFTLTLNYISLIFTSSHTLALLRRYYFG